MIEKSIEHTYRFVEEKGFVKATCALTGIVFHRFNKNVWWCKNTDTQVLVDQILADLEHGYQQFQSQQDKQQRHTPNRRGSGSPANAPHITRKGRVTNREPRMKGGME